MYADVNLEDQQSEASLQASAFSSKESICIINEASDNHRCFHVCALFQHYLKAAPSVLLESPFSNPQLWISTHSPQKLNKLFIISVTVLSVFHFLERSTNRGQDIFWNEGKKSSLCASKQLLTITIRSMKSKDPNNTIKQHLLSILRHSAFISHVNAGNTAFIGSRGWNMSIQSHVLSAALY